jgi:hypothetical protein
LSGVEVQALAQRITNFLNDMPAAEARIVTLETTKATLEAKNEDLTSSVSSLREQLETTLGIVLSLRDVTPGRDPTNPLDLMSSTHDDLTTLKSRLGNLEFDMYSESKPTLVTWVWSRPFPILSRIFYL